MRLTWAACVLLAACALACTAGASESDGTSGGPPPDGAPVAREDFCAMLAEARCVGIQSCCTRDSQKYDDAAACVAGETARCELNEGKVVRSAQHELDEEAAGGLIAAVAAAGRACDAPRYVLAFEPLLEPAVEPGARCMFDLAGALANPCKGGDCVIGDADEQTGVDAPTGTCRLQLQPGERCDDVEADCVPGSACVNARCSEPPGLGDACQSPLSAECGPNAVCMGTEPGAYRCAAPRENGQAVLVPEQCRSGLAKFDVSSVEVRCAACDEHSDCHSSDETRIEDAVISVDPDNGYCVQGVCKLGDLSADDGAKRSGEPCDNDADCASLHCEARDAYPFQACGEPDVDALFCTSPLAWRDGGELDFDASGAVDGGSGDAGELDAGPIDAGRIDAGNAQEPVGPTVEHPFTGSTLWQRSWGDIAAEDSAVAVALDGEGRVLVGGRTLGSLQGGNAGAEDAFVSALSASGDVSWSFQWGSASFDEVLDLAVDGDGNVYAGGHTMGVLGTIGFGARDLFVAKLSPSGELLWLTQWGTTGYESVQAVVVDGDGNVYAGGNTQGALQGPNAGTYDAFVSKLTADGSIVWSRQWGTAQLDSVTALRVDGEGNVYAGGNTEGSTDGPTLVGFDPYVAKLSPEGETQWLSQWGSDAVDELRGLALDAAGNLYAGGNTLGDLQGASHGGQDAFVTKLRADGQVRWTRQWGTSGDDWVHGVALDAAGSIFAVGYSGSDLRQSFGGARPTAMVAKVDADNTLAWNTYALWDGVAYDAVVDGDGHLIAVGMGPGTSQTTLSWNAFAIALGED